MKNNEKKIIIFPTDTVYGIGTKIDDIENLKKIYQIKKRNLDKPISVLFYSLDQIEKIVFIDDNIRKIADIFWPGPLTLIVYTQNPSYFCIKEEKMGIRIPNHPLALKILKKLGPLRTTSINKSGQPSLNNYQKIKEKYGNKVDYVYPDNYKNLSSGISSTIIDTTTVKWQIIRRGTPNILKKLNKFIFKHFH
ncbi:L-threonylcarbamoyladenylate synthase [Candidatus Phytoplasma sacchari]|uniref:L-threonylcarbamoyladenylate synthase n=1 Tax=Candidatus Phytoplasma sacchari TaxID=2609813 RepID=A0ABY7M499_9MOLU|nr:L-threonylcarbamoyladenylate synthase [Candidatus Phytoplasma sacchari]KAB8122690.1 threonylcarbamoyl-AMP synthase [Candidatus Phytoplasma sacchari]WBL31506.1 L-threonylcarbamoyladenylate synthase [Candidatus Phytoplasma sacchari]